LRWDAKQFWKKDLDSSNCHTYYEHAKVFRDELILDAVAATCGNNICGLASSSVQAFDPEFWREILPNISMTKERSRAASIFVTETCMLNPELIDATLLNELTDTKLLPHIDPGAVEGLLDLIDIFRNVEHVEATTDEDLTGLQSRCIDSLVENYKNIPVADNKQLTSSSFD
jgi:hypothetical protein